MSNANAQQVGGGHYKGTTYQHWDFVMIALAGRYLEGNITKYITRWRKKNGLEDLKKARHYLTKLIEQFNLGNVTPLVSILILVVAGFLFLGLSLLSLSRKKR